MPTYLTQADFAARIKRTPSWVSQLKKEGRLVMSPDGRLVDAEASEALIGNTEQLDNPGVANRWEEHRSKQGQAPAAPSPQAGDDIAAESLRKSKAVTAHFNALKAKMEYQQAIGELVKAEEARAVAVEIGTAFRVALDRLDTLAPELAAAADEERVLGLLAGAREEILHGLSQQMERAAHRLGGAA